MDFFSDRKIAGLLVVVFTASIFCGAATAQDSADTSSFGGASGETGSSAAGSDKSPAELPAPNALRGLFTPQPQYPTPGTTIMNPETVPAHLGSDGSQPGRNPGSSGTVYGPDFGKHETTEAEQKNKDNPLKGLFTPQPQYPTPGTTIMNPDAIPKHVGDDSAQAGRQPGQAGQTYQPGVGQDNAEPSGNKDNVLKGLFVPQPQYPSPGKTIMNPDAVPRHLGDDSAQAGRQPGQSPAVYNPPAEPTLEELEAAAIAAATRAAAKAEGEKKEGDEKKAEGDKKEGDEKKAEGDKKEGDEKKAEGDKKEGDEKKAEGDKKEGDEKKAEGDKKEGDEKKAEGDEKKAEGDKVADKSKEKEEKKLEPKAEPYHPLREAILLMNSRQYQSSLDVLTRFLSKNPNSPQAVYTRAVVNVFLKRYEEAATDYRTVLKLVPSGDLHALAVAGLKKLHFQSPYGIE